MKSDREIVEAVRGGDIEEYALLVKRYENAMYGFLVHIIHNSHAAEEIAQEIFVRAYENLHRLRNPSAYGAWIFKMARREALRKIKADQKTYSIPHGYFSQTPMNCKETNDDRLILMEALAKLSFHDRTILLLKHLGGYTAQEIAVMNGKAIGSITKQLSRAYSQLRIELKEMES